MSNELDKLPTELAHKLAIAVAEQAAMVDELSPDSAKVVRHVWCIRIPPWVSCANCLAVRQADGSIDTRPCRGKARLGLRGGS